jgi:hypothetical protein
VGAHWFENEKVAYFFFRVSGNTTYSGNSLFEWNVQLSSVAHSLKQYQPLNFSQGIHQHQLVSCGADICGSYSFAAESAPANISLKLRYHPQSSLFVESRAPVQVHLNDGSSQSYSSLIYGVFDETNNYVETRVHHNFGFPSNSEINQYGMIRSFRIHDVQLTSWTKADLNQLKIQSQSATLFPAKRCMDWTNGANSKKIEGVESFSGAKTWLHHDFAGGPLLPGTCFHVDFLKANGETILTESAIARKNPQLIEEKLELNTPLKPVIKIPLVLTYCANDPASVQLMSQIFLDYQRFILGIPGSEVDVCFRIGYESQFRDEIKLTLLKKLQAARQSNSALQDYIFVVAFNHKFNPEFQRFQEIAAEEIGLLVEDERTKVSPRLVGSFVYDSDANFTRQDLSSKSIIWCPQDIKAETNGLVKAYGDGANCVADLGGLVKLGSVINFLVPMGPFPSRDSYEDYLHEYGDKGFAKDPQLEVKSVTTNVNTVQDTNGLTTFFDGQRLDLSAEEGMRVCYEKDSEGLIASLKLKKVNSDKPIIDSEEIQSIFNSAEGSGTYLLGLQWTYPFIGEISYTSPLTGKILGQIPFRKDSKAHREVGDRKWQRPTWNFGPFFQRCQRFCDHPYFDEAGTYQLESNWRDINAIGCTHSKFPDHQL